MSNSNLVNCTKLSPNYNKRNGSIRKITIHHMAGNLSVETCGNVFANEARQASSNYGIGTDGRVGLYVEEHNRAWTSSSPENDHQAVTIEVANDEIGGNWHVSDVALNKLIELCVDICKRNGIARLNFTGDKNGNLTMHRYFANTNCPGPYLESKYQYIADQVNKKLNGENVLQPEKPKPPVTNEKRYAEDGTFHFTTAVQIRTQPQDGYETGLTYYPGESVIYHHVILNKNGYNWIEYLRSNGSTGYIKVRELSSGDKYGYAV